MPIVSPNLDDLRFDRIVEELKRRIPVYAPEWTNWNDSDPGIAMIQLFAYLGEQLGYRLNRVPEKAHIALLELLGIRLAPAHAAHTRVGFFLGAPSLVSGFTIEAASRVTRKAAPPAIFETDEALSVTPAQPIEWLATKNPYLWDLLRLDDAGNREPSPTDADLPGSIPANDSRWLTVGWDGQKPKPTELPLAPVRILPRTTSGVDHPYLWIAIDFNPALDAGFLGTRVTLTVQLDDDEQPDPRHVEHCAPITAGRELAPPLIDWLAYYDAEAATMRRVPSRIDDTTEKLTRSGTLRFDVPFGMGPLPDAAWANLRDASSPAPVDACEDLVGQLKSALGTPPSPGDPIPFDLTGFQSALTAAATAAQAASAAIVSPVAHPLDPKLRDPEKTRGWLRIGPIAPTAAKLRYLGFNAVGATNVITVRGERLGRSDGRPGQQLQLAFRNVVTDSLELAIQESNAPGALMTTWTRIDTLEAAGAFDRVYELDPEAGVVRFGDGAHGRIPPLVPNAGAIVALRYRHGGGVAGESPAGTLTVSAVQNVGLVGVVNFVSAAGGRDAETLLGAELRARRELATRDRAVTATDFEWIALQTPDVRVRRAIVIPRRRPLQATLTAFEGKALRRANEIAALAAAADCAPCAPGGKPGRAAKPPAHEAKDAGGLDDDFEAPGVVTVVVVPDVGDFEPTPTRSFERAVCRQLDAHRLITTEVYVAPPQYCRVQDVFARVKGRAGYTRAQLQDLVGDTLTRYLDVLVGGDDGTGAPFGGQLHIADLIARVMRTEGIERVEVLSASFTRSKTNASPRKGKLRSCPAASDEYDRVELGAEETTSIDLSSFTLSTV
jgi:hypothetical protein